MPDEKSIETALKDLEANLIEILQNTNDFRMIDHLARAVADVHKARVILEE